MSVNDQPDPLFVGCSRVTQRTNLFKELTTILLQFDSLPAYDRLHVIKLIQCKIQEEIDQVVKENER